ncbi:MAG: arginine--tRNA ligase [Gammaproteobacteria bacterium]|nr:arginine--tRNA ligase [Gammaproteobacteria bacterium]
MNIREQLDQHISVALSQALQELDLEGEFSAIVKQAGRPEFGDYQANGIMGAAKHNRTNPRELAETVLRFINLEEMVDNLEVAGPGFINIHLRSDYLADRLTLMLHDERLGIEPLIPKTVVIDYSSPNLAKEMHIGHLRSTAIGDAIARTLEFLGHNVIRANHMGDWGAQFGSLLAYMDQLSNDADGLSRGLSDLELFYQEASAQFREDPVFAQRAREFVVKLQGGDPKCINLWNQFIKESVSHCQSIYDALNISLTPDDIYGESFYNEFLSEVISDLSSAGLLTESDGAQCVFLDEFKGKDGAPLPAIIRKSDGGYPYMATDLAAVKYRSQTLKADSAYYFVDARQSLHLRQLFAVARAAGYISTAQDFRHLPNGTIMGEDGRPFKTRTGGAVKLADVLTEAKSRAFDLVSTKNAELDQQSRKSIADVVGIGAVKYAELSKNRTSDYIFNWDAMLSFEGNTAPYLLYAVTRIFSIFRRAGVEPSQLTGAIVLSEPAEKSLAIKLVQFPEAINSVVTDCLPNLLCNYLFELSGQFMSFYETCPVLKTEDKTRASRLLLCVVTANTLGKGLELLGIETVEQM